MPIWALLQDGREISAFRSIRNDIAREDCEAEAIEKGLGHRYPSGVGLAPGVEIVCIMDGDE